MDETYRPGRDAGRHAVVRTDVQLRGDREGQPLSKVQVGCGSTGAGIAAGSIGRRWVLRADEVGGGGSVSGQASLSMIGWMCSTRTRKRKECSVFPWAHGSERALTLATPARLSARPGTRRDRYGGTSGRSWPLFIATVPPGPAELTAACPAPADLTGPLPELLQGAFPHLDSRRPASSIA
jgi:hypothetical protein